MNPPTPPNLQTLRTQINTWGTQLGFAQIKVSDINLRQAEQRLNDWLARNFHGEMSYMHRHGTKRTRPAQLHPGTIRVLTARMDYLPQPLVQATRALQNPTRGYISRYALGRDYHKLMRTRLQKLATRIQTAIGDFGYRAFCDSAPVMEKALAQKSGHGWLGKHTNIINRRSGSFFFLGELYTDLPLPPDSPTRAHCGTCTACIDICPTRAIVAPYQLDARRCISYLTIELKGSIPLQFRKPIGNRIFGCDDCQLVCPWNRYAKITTQKDFAIRHALDGNENENANKTTPNPNPTDLIKLFAWSETDFARYTQGSAIRRLGHTRWLRNIAIALGNARPTTPAIIKSLKTRTTHPSPLVREHVQWALEEHAKN